MDDRINGKTIILGLMANPIGHTVSPQLHNTLSAMLGIDAVYIPFKVEKDSLGDAVKGLKACNLLGFNATIPFKEELLKYVDECTEEVRLMGSANTVKNTCGRLYAYNTDADGFIRSYKEETGGGFEGREVVMLGAGGTARSLAVRIASKGAAKLYLANRTLEKAQEIANTINATAGGIIEPLSLSDAKIKGIIENCDIIVNTTSLGMYPHIEECPLGDDIRFNHKQIVYDVIYNPAKTRLLKLAESCGCKTVNGLGMLFYQGILAYEIWMDMKIPDNVISQLSKEFSNNFGK